MADKSGKPVSLLQPFFKYNRSGRTKKIWTTYDTVYPSKVSNPASTSIPCKLVPMAGGKFRVMVAAKHARRMNPGPIFKDVMGRKFKPIKVIFVGTGKLAGAGAPLYYFSNNVHDSEPEGGPYTTPAEAKKAARAAGFKPDSIVVRY